MGTFGSRLKALRKERNLTQSQLGKSIGVSDVTVGYWEKDLNGPSGKSLMKLAQCFGVTENFLISGKEQSSNVVPASLDGIKVPVISWVQAGSWTSASDASNQEGVMEYIVTNEVHSSTAFALKVKGNSMEPEFKQGDTIVVDPELYPRPGEYVVAKNGSHEATFKKYRSRGTSDTGEDVFELIPLNEDYATMNSLNTKVAIIGVVVEHRRKMRV